MGEVLARIQKLRLIQNLDARECLAVVQYEVIRRAKFQKPENKDLGSEDSRITRNNSEVLESSLVTVTLEKFWTSFIKEMELFFYSAAQAQCLFGNQNKLS